MEETSSTADNGYITAEQFQTVSGKAGFPKNNYLPRIFRIFPTTEWN